MKKLYYILLFSLIFLNSGKAQTIYFDMDEMADFRRWQVLGPDLFREGEHDDFVNLPGAGNYMVTMTGGNWEVNPGSYTFIGSQSGSDFGTFILEDPLPVELTTFTASVFENKVMLNWQTATEVNNYGFEVERQIQNQVKNDEWEKIVFIEGHGNSNSPKNYSFSDSENLNGTVQYRLKQIDIDGQFEYSDVIEIVAPMPEAYELGQNYPNPFNPTTVISYNLPNASSVQIIIYNTLGEEVATLVNQQQNAGTYNVEFNASNIPSGIYFYSIRANNFVSIKKMMYLK